MCDYAGNKWSHRNSKSLKEKFGSHTRKILNRLKKYISILGTSHIIRKALQFGT
jgi:hypothetical protein